MHGSLYLTFLIKAFCIFYKLERLTSSLTSHRDWPRSAAANQTIQTPSNFLPEQRLSVDNIRNNDEKESSVGYKRRIKSYAAKKGFVLAAEIRQDMLLSRQYYWVGRYAS